MHILILVTTLLMLLAIIGSTRFELFLNSMGIRSAYEKYMQEDERSYYNSRELAKYDDPPPKSTTPKNEPEKKSAPGIAKLNIRPLIFENEKFTLEYTTAVKRTFIRLIENTYGNENFFKDVRPADFVDIFIQEARRGICGGKIKQVNDLAGVSFQNPAMRKIFFEMIRERTPGSTGPPSLLDFLTLRTTETPVRVFLAKRQLLLALYQGKAVVNEVIAYRKHPFDVYVPSLEAQVNSANADDAEETPKLASDDQATMQKASEQFKIQSFNSQRYPDIPESFLDFTVSGSVPPK